MGLDLESHKRRLGWVKKRTDYPPNRNLGLITFVALSKFVEVTAIYSDSGYIYPMLCDLIQQI